MRRISAFIVVALMGLAGCGEEEVRWWEGCVDVIEAVDVDGNWSGIEEACSTTAQEVATPTTLSPEAIDACIDDVNEGLCGTPNVCGNNPQCSSACDTIRVFTALQTDDSAGYSQADVLCSS
jgi:hypothetical protein